MIWNGLESGMQPFSNWFTWCFWYPPGNWSVNRIIELWSFIKWKKKSGLAYWMPMILQQRRLWASQLLDLTVVVPIFHLKITLGFSEVSQKWELASGQRTIPSTCFCPIEAKRLIGNRKCEGRNVLVDIWIRWPELFRFLYVCACLCLFCWSEGRKCDTWSIQISCKMPHCCQPGLHHGQFKMILNDKCVHLNREVCQKLCWDGNLKEFSLKHTIQLNISEYETVQSHSAN